MRKTHPSPTHSPSKAQSIGQGGGAGWFEHRLGQAQTPANTSGGAPACIPSTSSVRSSTFIAGNMTDSPATFSPGGMLATSASSMPQRLRPNGGEEGGRHRAFLDLLVLR